MKTMQIFLLLISLTTLAADREPSLEEVFKEAQLVCDALEFEENRPRCRHLFSELQLKKSTKHVLSIARQACPEFAIICDRAYVYMGTHASKYQQEFKSVLEARCSVDSEFCEVLGELLISENQIEKGLEYLQKDFEANGGYTYATALKKHKDDSTLVHRVAWEKCQSDDSECEFLIRNYPEHPQIEKALVAADRYCHHQINKNYGYDACSSLGRYHFNHGQKTRAIEYWSMACSKNAFPCLEIIASDDADQQKKKWAFEKFCKDESRFVNGNINYLRKQNCQKRAPATVPDKLIAEVKKLFQ